MIGKYYCKFLKIIFQIVLLISVVELPFPKVKIYFSD